VYLLVSFELSVPVQVIAWKDSFRKCERDVEHCSLTHSNLAIELLPN